MATKKGFVIATRDSNLLVLNFVEALSRGDAANVLYASMRREGVVTLPPIAWTVELSSDTPHAFATLKVAD